MLGIVSVYKPKGWTSFDVVNKLKRVFNTSKIGHLGTLDPMAEGVLPIAIGNATKLFDFYLKKKKKYIADFEFGYETDSLDADGEIINKTNRVPTITDIEKIQQEFVGEISQVPPKFSAVKINGKRAYSLARSNVEFELKAKNIYIDMLKCLGEISPNCYRFEIICSAGTYIRSIARDLAHRLGSLATMVKLVRVESGPFNLENSKTMEQIINSPSESIISLDEVLSDLPRIIIPENKWQLVINGVKIGLKTGGNDVLSRIYLGEELFGLGKNLGGRLEVVCRLYEGGK